MRACKPQFARHLGSLAHQFLVGQIVECASLANLAPVDDKPANLGFSQRCHRHGRTIARLLRDLPSFLKFAQYSLACGLYLARKSSITNGNSHPDQVHRAFPHEPDLGFQEGPSIRALQHCHLHERQRTTVLNSSSHQAA